MQTKTFPVSPKVSVIIFSSVAYKVRNTVVLLEIEHRQSSSITYISQIALFHLQDYQVNFDTFHAEKHHIARSIKIRKKCSQFIRQFSTDPN